MIDFLKRIKKQTDEKSRNEKFAKIQVGAVLMFRPTEWSHEVSPYYVVVVEKGEDYFITAIPEKHELIVRDSNFNYHLDRCKIVGNLKTHGSLLYNQKLIARCSSGGHNAARKISI